MAWPRLVDAVSNFLSSPQKLEIAQLWELHFLRIWCQDDFVSNFCLLLHYDIRVRKSYTNCNLNFDPSEWQQGVWDQVLNATHSAQLNYFQGGPSGSSRPLVKPRSSTALFQPASCSLSRCIFCGAFNCYAWKVCRLEKTPFLTLVGSTWKTA